MSSSISHRDSLGDTLSGPRAQKFQDSKAGSDEFNETRYKNDSLISEKEKDLLKLGVPTDISLIVG